MKVPPPASLTSVDASVPRTGSGVFDAPPPKTSPGIKVADKTDKPDRNAKSDSTKGDSTKSDSNAKSDAKPGTLEKRKRPERPANDAPAARVMVPSEGVSSGAKLFLVVVVVAAAVAFWAYRGKAPALTSIGGGQAASFWGATPVEPDALMLKSGPANELTATKDGHRLQAVYVPKLPPGAGVDVVIAELYGKNIMLTGRPLRINDLTVLNASGKIHAGTAKADGDEQPVRVKAYANDNEAWVLSVSGDDDFVNSQEALHFLSSLQSSTTKH